MSNFNNKNSDRVFTNYSIRAQNVLCIDHNNINLGVIPFSEALNLAQSQGLDLVQVSPQSKDRPPTCKILDSGKYKYEISKKKKESDKKQRESIIKTKEIKFRPTTDSNDLKTKARKVEEFVKEGCKVKLTITFKGREISHQEIAFQTLKEFMNLLPDLQTLGKPSLEKKDLSIFIGKKEAHSVKEAS